MNQVEAHLPSQDILTVFVVFSYIWSAAIDNTIIDTEIYDNAFD